MQVEVYYDYFEEKLLTYTNGWGNLVHSLYNIMKMVTLRDQSTILLMRTENDIVNVSH